MEMQVREVELPMLDHVTVGEQILNLRTLPLTVLVL